jgi:hypothetical protein
VYAFWKEMLDGNFAEYPKDVLIPLKKSLGDLIAGKIGG